MCTAATFYQHGVVIDFSLFLRHVGNIFFSRGHWKLGTFVTFTDRKTILPTLYHLIWNIVNQMNKVRMDEEVSSLTKSTVVKSLIRMFHWRWFVLEMIQIWIDGDIYPRSHISMQSKASRTIFRQMLKGKM